MSVNGCEYISRQTNEPFNKRQKTSPSEIKLPDEIFLKIFTSFPNHREIIKVGRVCKQWHRVGGEDSLWSKLEITDLFKIRIFGAKQWREFFNIEIKDEPLLDKRSTIIELEKLSKFDVENKGLTLLTVFKGLTSEMLEEMARGAHLRNIKSLLIT